MNSTCMRLCDLNFSFVNFHVSAKVSCCQNNKRIQIQYGRPCLHFVSSNYKNISYYVLFVFIILTC